MLLPFGYHLSVILTVYLAYEVFDTSPAGGRPFSKPLVFAAPDGAVPGVSVVVFRALPRRSWF